MIRSFRVKPESSLRTLPTFMSAQRMACSRARSGGDPGAIRGHWPNKTAPPSGVFAFVFFKIDAHPIAGEYLYVPSEIADSKNQALQTAIDSGFRRDASHVNVSSCHIYSIFIRRLHHAPLKTESESPRIHSELRPATDKNPNK